VSPFLIKKKKSMKKSLDIFKTKYDCVFSLGAACFSAELLTKAKLRVFSSPFDWISEGTLDGKGDMLCNNFKDFLNIEDLEKVGERDYPENCDIYKNNSNGIMFHHDFPKGEELSENFQKAKDKYNRRINRLNEKLSNSKNVLIVYMEIPDKFMNTEGEIISLSEKLNKNFDGINITILYVKHNKEMRDEEFKMSQISSNAYIAELYNLARDDHGHGNYKNCKKFLSKIKIRKTFGEMLLKVAKGRKRIRVYLFGVKVMSFKYAD